MPDSYSLEGKKIWVCGHNGMVGSAIVRRLENEGVNILVASRSELDLTSQANVLEWIAQNKPDAVFLTAAKVGGIQANDSYPVDFLYENLMIEANVIHSSFVHGVEKLMFLGSSCVYPKLAQQPIEEKELLTGALEPTNQWYAVAKIAGIKLCEAYRSQYNKDFISVMPTNLYGQNDNYDPATSHVPAALMRRFHEAKEQGDENVEVWGTGDPLREFMHVDDLADACFFLMRNYSADELINVGSGEEVSIKEFASIVKDIVGFKGNIVFDSSKPDGAPRKLMDSSKLNSLGWKPNIGLKEGLSATYNWYLKQFSS